MKYLFSINFIFLVTLNNSFAQWVNLPTNNSQFLFGVHFINNDSGFVFGDGILLKTIDGGLNWSIPQTSMLSQFTSMKFVNDSTGYLVGDGGAILKSLDNGNNWVTQNAIPQLFYNVDFADPMNGIIVGDEASIRITSDGGQNWSQITAPYLFGDSLFHYELRTVQFINDSVAFAAGGPSEGSTGILIKTTDRGNTWNTVFESYDFPVFLEIKFINDTTAFACGSCHINNPFCFRSKILKTTDGGVSWTEIYFDWAYELRSIEVIGNYIYSVGFDLGGSPVVVKSEDLGINWNYQITPAIIYPYQVFFSDSLTGYVVGDNGVVLKTINGGVGFSELVLNNTFNIFPNPTTGLLTLEFNVDNQNSKIEVYNMLYQLVISVDINNMRQGILKENIDLRDLNDGIYLVKVKSNDRFRIEKILLSKN